jgi:hypothetical protein
VKADYPAFSNFRALLTIWDENLEKQRVQQLQDNPNLSFFFKKNNDVFGAPEESRLVFARMKNPEKDEKQWVKDASFAAVDLKRAAEGDSTQILFSNKDLDKIKIIEKEAAFKGLIKKD